MRGEGEILNNVLHARHNGTLHFLFSWQITGVQRLLTQNSIYRKNLKISYTSVD
jgi:hypothetical protein